MLDRSVILVLRWFISRTLNILYQKHLIGVLPVYKLHHTGGFSLHNTIFVWCFYTVYWPKRSESAVSQWELFRTIVQWFLVHLLLF